ncbi:hypothetical protein FB451DRAFT_1176044 [Mycena latifolia]|nr:hypothetical protein FB451DRAFT_1176044 [Mycena latifolia]
MSDSDVAVCIAAILTYLETHPPLPFPTFLSLRVKFKVTATSHRTRSGLEHDGDRQIYVILELLLRSIILANDSRAARFYKAIEVALSCNKTLAYYMARLNLQLDTKEKEGGDTFETIFGALFYDMRYQDVANWLIKAFRPLIIVCLDFLGPKRKRVEAPLMEPADSESSSKPTSAKRPRTSNDGTGQFTTSPGAAEALSRVLLRVGTMPRYVSSSYGLLSLSLSRSTVTAPVSVSSSMPPSAPKTALFDITNARSVLSLPLVLTSSRDFRVAAVASDQPSQPSTFLKENEVRDHASVPAAPSFNTRTTSAYRRELMRSDSPARNRSNPHRHSDRSYGTTLSECTWLNIPVGQKSNTYDTASSRYRYARPFFCSKISQCSQPQFDSPTMSAGEAKIAIATTTLNITPAAKITVAGSTAKTAAKTSNAGTPAIAGTASHETVVSCSRTTSAMAQFLFSKVLDFGDSVKETIIEQVIFEYASPIDLARLLRTCRTVQAIIARPRCSTRLNECCWRAARARMGNLPAPPAVTAAGVWNEAAYAAFLFESRFAEVFPLRSLCCFAAAGLHLELPHWTAYTAGLSYAYEALEATAWLPPHCPDGFILSSAATNQDREYAQAALVDAGWKIERPKYAMRTTVELNAEWDRRKESWPAIARNHEALLSWKRSPEYLDASKKSRISTEKSSSSHKTKIAHWREHQRIRCTMTQEPKQETKQVLEHCSPFDLVQLGLASRAFRAVIAAHEYLWVQAQLNLSSGTCHRVPPLPVIEANGNFSQSAYASWLFGGGSCTWCSKWTESQPTHFIFRFRACSATCKALLLSASNLYVDRTQKFDDFSWGKWLPRIERELPNGETIKIYSARATKDAERERQQAVRVDAGNSHRDLKGFPCRTSQQRDEECTRREQSRPELLKNGFELEAWHKHYLKEHAIIWRSNYDFLMCLATAENKKIQGLMRCPTITSLFVAFNRDLELITHRYPIHELGRTVGNPPSQFGTI